MLKFNAATGIEISDISEVRESIRDVWVKAFTEQGLPTLNTDPESPAGQIIDSQTASIAQKDEELLFLANQFNPLTAEGIWQDALAKIYFLTRHKAVASSAVVTCTGLTGTIIPKGAQLRSIVDDSVWNCRESAIIGAEGTADVVFDCSVTGPISANEHTLTKITTTIAGWDSADNQEAAIIGQDEESQSAFEDRRYRSVGLNSRSSIQSAYSRIAALDGVIAVAARQNRSNRTIMIDGVVIDPHCVYFCVLGGDTNEIALALYNTISAGCGYTGTEQVTVKDEITKAADVVCFSRPSALAVKIVVTLCKTNEYSSSSDDLIKDVIYQNFYGTKSAQVSGLPPVLRVTMDTTLYSSRFDAALVAAGFTQVLSTKLAMPASGKLKDTIQIPINICPTLNKDDIMVIWQEPVTAKDNAVFGFTEDDENITGFNQGPFVTPESEFEEAGNDSEN